jgi:glycosyltransferase EpsF
VVHIVESLDRGSTENWLVRMLAHARRRGIDVDWTFYCALGRPGAIDETARALGARVIHSPVPLGRKLAFIRTLRGELRRGSYDVLHCHHDLVSAVYLLAAAGLPIRTRLVHVHNADESVPTSNRLKARVYRPLLRQACLRMSDGIVGISQHTLNTFLAGRSRRPGDRVNVHGIDPAPFRTAARDRAGFRRSLGLAEDTRIVLFAGRMVPEKNPVFAVDVVAEMYRSDPKVAGVFVGSGALEEDVRRRAHERELGPAFRQLGWRDDIPEVMSCADWFILPHPEDPVEGFGFAVVEAQLAGLRMLLSNGILDDPLLPTASFRRLPLAAGPLEWARAARELLAEPDPQQPAVLAALEASQMDMDRALDALLDLYR